MDKYSDNLDQLFGALSDSTRRDILTRLCQGPASVSELKEPHAMALPNLLKHIHVLESSGLIETQKQGRTRVCVLRPDALSATEAWLQEQRQLLHARFDRLEDYIETLKAQSNKEKDDDPAA